MNERQSRLFVATILVLFVLWLALKRARLANSSQPVAESAAAPNLAPPDSTPTDPSTPGMVAAPWYMNGANAPMQTPESIQIGLTVNPWNAINQDYMPLFGFVGMAS